MTSPSVIAPSGNNVRVALGFYHEDPDNIRDELIKDRHRNCPSLWLAWTRFKSQVTAWWIREEGRQFSHVELMFSDEKSVVSATEETGVHYDVDRMLSNDRYTHFLHVYVSPVQEALMRKFAQEHCNKPFNSNGRFWNSVPLLRSFLIVDTEGRSFYCSELITQLLKIANLCAELDPRCTNPTQLYLYLLRTKQGKLGYNEKESCNQRPGHVAVDTGAHFNRLTGISD